MPHEEEYLLPDFRQEARQSISTEDLHPQSHERLHAKVYFPPRGSERYGATNRLPDLRSES
jgi:hypothetical protein